MTVYTEGFQHFTFKRNKHHPVACGGYDAYSSGGDGLAQWMTPIAQRKDDGVDLWMTLVAQRVMTL